MAVEDREQHQSFNCPSLPIKAQFRSCLILLRLRSVTSLCERGLDQFTKRDKSHNQIEFFDKQHIRIFQTVTILQDSIVWLAASLDTKIGNKARETITEKLRIHPFLLMKWRNLGSLLMILIRRGYWVRKQHRTTERKEFLTFNRKVHNQRDRIKHRQTTSATRK